MSAREREGLTARIRQIRRAAARDRPPPPSTAGPQNEEIRVLQARVAHLEQLLQGLQDSVHRESLRHSERIADLEERIKPAVLGRALSKDARERGL
jgi:hypothetical protein